nr:DNA polymerase III subunit gamma/tau [Actinomycetota bacterium]
MAYLSLYRKYRPQTFSELLGQEHVSTTLSNAITEDRVAHAYLFTGPRGTGKTSTARILAKALNCEKGPTPSPCGVCAPCVSITDGSSLDVIEMDAASHSKVDETRDILAGVPLATAGGRRKVYVIDEVHMLSTGSFNALLKTLEEPPGHVLFILATTEAHKVLPTIVSRTQRFDFRRVPAEIVEDHLAQVAKLETIDIDQSALAVVARHAEGSVRDALSALDQLASLQGHIAVEDAERMLGERSEEVFFEMFDAIVRSDPGGVFSSLHQLVAQGADPRQLALGVLQHARSLLLVRTAPDAAGLLDVSDEDRAGLLAQSENFTNGTLMRILDLVAKAITEMRNSPNHRLLLEVALVRAAAPETDPSADGLLGRIERLERRIGLEGGVTIAGNVIDSKPTARREVVKEEDLGKAGSVEPRPAPSTQTPTSTSGTGPATPAAAESAPPTDDKAPGVAAAPEHLGLGHMRDAWPATLKEVNRVSKRVWGLLSPSRPVSFDEGTLTVEVQSEFHRSSMTEERASDALLDGLHASLGIRPEVAFVARGQDVTPEPAQSDDVAEYAQARPAEAPQDPVEMLKKGFGAEVVEER